MSSKRALERDLAGLEGFEEPRVELEQYPTPADLAATLLHLADLQGDVAGRTVVDLGAGTGILAIGAALRGADRVVGIEVDPDALAIARRNAARAGAAGDAAVQVEWTRGDGARPPLCPDEPVTAVMNPPFGAQRGSRHADRAFLETASDLAAVSYSIHNADSHDFVEAFASDEGGVVTHAFAAVLDVERQFPFHEAETRSLDVEVFRIEWGPSSDAEGRSG